MIMVSGMIMMIILIISSGIVPDICLLPAGDSETKPSALTPSSHQPLSPPGSMPVVILNGTAYEMGYQYGLQVPEYIAITRDSAWASALTNASYDETIKKILVSRDYIANELVEFDFISFFRGMSDAMNSQGYSFSPLDPLMMLQYGNTRGPGPDEHCTAFVAAGNIPEHPVITGVNFDYYMLPSNSYGVLVVLYPMDGYSCLLPSGAGRLGSNAVINDKGLVYQFTSSPSQAAGDSGPGIPGFLELPYIGMTAENVSEGEEKILNITRSIALNRILADRTGRMEVIESTRKAYAIRYPPENEAGRYIIATNHYLDPGMKPSQDPWDPVQFYPSSQYRYLTADRIIRDHHGQVNYSVAKEILSSSDWWDGTRWHQDDPFSSNTINRFQRNFSTLYSLITIPEKQFVSLCSGNPGIPVWGTKAPDLTGTYVNLTISRTPEELVYLVRSEADTRMWNTLPSVSFLKNDEIRKEWSILEEVYWEGVWWHDRAILENDQNEKMTDLGKAATAFVQVASSASRIQEYEI